LASPCATSSTPRAASTKVLVQEMKRRIGCNRKNLATINKNTYFCSAKYINRMQTITTNISQANTTTSFHPKKKVYPKTLKGCFSFEDFQDLLNEKIRKHYEEV
jgi:hypothetical protein